MRATKKQIYKACELVETSSWFICTALTNAQTGNDTEHSPAAKHFVEFYGNPAFWYEFDTNHSPKGRAQRVMALLWYAETRDYV